MGKYDFVAMEKQVKEKEVSAPVNATPLEVEYDNTWGKQKAGEVVEEINIALLTTFKGKNGRKQPFKLNKDKVEKLAESIRDIGLATPLIVRVKNDKYQILSGHHRFDACKKLGMEKIPCIIRKVSDQDAEKYVMECNIQRLKLLPSEYGKILERYMDIKETLDLTVEEVANKFGFSRKMLYRYVNLSKLTEDLQDQVDYERIYIEAIDLLVKLSEEQQNKLCEFIKLYPNKTIVVNSGKNILDMFAENDLENITIEMYLECFNKPKKNGYKNKIYNNVYKKYDVPEDKQIDEKEIDKLVTDYLDDYFSKRFEKAKVQEIVKEEVKEETKDEIIEEESEDLER